MESLLFSRTITQELDFATFARHKLFTILRDGSVKYYRPLDTKYISDVVTYSRFKLLMDGHGHLFIGQPGCGKTHFIVNKLMRFTREDYPNKRILIIVPRIALSHKIKSDIEKEYQLGILDKYTMKGLNDVHEFGNADIYLMHDLNNERVRNEIQHKADNNLYQFLVLDEVHAFVHDAPFNAFTQDAFDFLMRVTNRITRIYFTATPDCVFKRLRIAEEQSRLIYNQNSCYGNSCNHWDEPNITIYDVKKDYSYVNLKFYTDPNALLKEIAGSENKSLIFVRSIVQGKKYLDDFGEEQAEFMCAENKLTTMGDELNNITSNETFSKKILIVTKFLDVGISFSDLSIKNIVVFHYDKTDLIQMIGRIRQNGTDRINVLVNIPKIGDIRKDLHFNKKSLKEFIETKNSLENPKNIRLNTIPDHCFIETSIKKVIFHFNDFVIDDLKYRNTILESFCKCKEELFALNFTKIIESWIPGCIIQNENNSFDPDALSKVYALFEPYINKEIKKCELVTLQNDAFDILNIKTQTADAISHKLRNVLKELSPSLCLQNLSSKKKPGMYVIKKEV